ncbi:MAG: GYF domain-containing protein [Muribaculaceae bacterium]|nr:GYF domain-containing protein [Muribaculaceae bacterium]
MKNWYILYNGQQIGPMEMDNLLAYGLNPNSQVWADGMSGWVAAYTVPELMSLIHRATPPRSNNAFQTGASGKSNLVAGLLAIFLGYLGVQYFYLGKISGGVITILLSCVTCGIWSLVMIVQGIIMITMTPEEFDRKFVNTNATLPLF